MNNFEYLILILLPAALARACCSGVNSPDMSVLKGEWRNACSLSSVSTDSLKLTICLNKVVYLKK